MFRRKAAMYPATHPVATSQRARPIVDTMIDPCFLVVCLFCASREDMRGCRGSDRPCFRGSVFGGDLSGICAGSQCLRGSEREEGWSKEGDETGSIMDIGQCCWENDGIVPSTCRFHDFRGCNGGAWAVSVRRCLGLRVASCYRTGVGPSWEGSGHRGRGRSKFPALGRLALQTPVRPIHHPSFSNGDGGDGVPIWVLAPSLRRQFLVAPREARQVEKGGPTWASAVCSMLTNASQIAQHAVQFISPTSKSPPTSPRGGYGFSDS